MPLRGWDHLELYVGNAKQSAYFYEHAFGFTRTAYAGPETGVRDRASYVLEQPRPTARPSSGAPVASPSRTGSRTSTVASSSPRSGPTARTCTPS
jgi:catechol 2,3-dioxygenase-like lactoylglutathione lyase family enzyme